MVCKTLPVILACIASVIAESHVITFVNNCGAGTPILSRNFEPLPIVNDVYTASGPFDAAIAYLDTGCDFQGDACGIVEITLINGGVSTIDISLIPKHAFNVPTSISFAGGCDGIGAACMNASCTSDVAFYVTDDYEAQRHCMSDDSGVNINFC